jgi:hypothetical protein
MPQQVLRCGTLRWMVEITRPKNTLSKKMSSNSKVRSSEAESQHEKQFMLKKCAGADGYRISLRIVESTQ